MLHCNKSVDAAAIRHIINKLSAFIATGLPSRACQSGRKGSAPPWRGLFAVLFCKRGWADREM